jgi:hypothetical protein
VGGRRRRRRGDRDSVIGRNHTRGGGGAEDKGLHLIGGGAPDLLHQLDSPRLVHLHRCAA